MPKYRVTTRWTETVTRDYEQDIIVEAVNEKAASAAADHAHYSAWSEAMAITGFKECDWADDERKTSVEQVEDDEPVSCRARLLTPEELMK